MRKIGTMLLMTLVFLLGTGAQALALSNRQGSVITVAAHETINDDLALAGNSIMVDGIINGDLLATGQNLVINGTVNGNLIAAASSVEIRGTVNGTVVSMGDTTVVTGRIERNLISAGNRVSIEQNGSVGHNWIAAGDRLELLGSVGRGVAAAGDRVILSGVVSNEVRAAVQNLEIRGSAAVGGPVTYWSDREVQVGSGAQLGTITRHEQAWDWQPQFRPWFTSPWWAAIKFGGFMAVGLLLLALFPRLRERFPALLIAKPWQTPLAGFLTLIALPIAAVLLMLTLIGLPLGLLSILLLPVMIYLGQVLVAWTIGQLLSERIDSLKAMSWQVLFLIGALLTTLLIELPVVGGLFGGAALFYGLGGLYFIIVQRHEVA